MLARQTNVAACGIGILTSCAEVDGCWLLMVNRRTVAELSCAHSSTQGAGSLPMMSSLFLEDLHSGVTNFGVNHYEPAKLKVVEPSRPAVMGPPLTPATEAILTLPEPDADELAALM